MPVFFQVALLSIFRPGRVCVAPDGKLRWLLAEKTKVMNRRIRKLPEQKWEGERGAGGQLTKSQRHTRWRRILIGTVL